MKYQCGIFYYKRDFANRLKPIKKCDLANTLRPVEREYPHCKRDLAYALKPIKKHDLASPTTMIKNF